MLCKTSFQQGAKAAQVNKLEISKVRLFYDLLDEAVFLLLMWYTATLNH